MAKYESVTRPTDVSAADFVARVEHPVRRADAEVLLELFGRVTGQPPVMWGPTMVGYGRYQYEYDSGHSGEAFAAGFSPRKASLSLYGLTWQPEAEELLAKLGKHKVGASCLYVNKLADIDLDVLEELIRTGYRYITEDFRPSRGMPDPA